MALDYPAIDVDNHYYEPLDAFTRHLDKKFKRRGVQMVAEGKRPLAVIGDRVNHFIPNPTFDPIIVPGCLDLLFRGVIPDGIDPASLMKVERLTEHPEYQNRDARITVMDTQGIETAFMLPTFGCGVGKALEELDFVLARGAKLVLVRPAPVPGAAKPRSLGDPVHDPAWARLAEA